MATTADSGSLQQFFACSPDMLFLLNGEGALLALSEPLAHLLGPEAKPGTALAAFLHPDAHGPLTAALTALAAGEPSAELTCLVQAANGRVVPLALRARRMAENGNVCGSLHESAALSPEVAALVDEGRLLHILFDNLNMMVWAVDREGTFFYHEGKGSQASGLRPRELIGRNFFDIQNGPAETGRLQQALAGQLAHSITDTPTVSLENWYIPVRDAAGEVNTVVGLSFDLTEIRKAEKDLKARIELIERQQQVIRAMSTPIIEVWDKVLTLPMVGLVDSVRAAEVMDNLLQQVSRKGARFAILDLTGVEAVDTSTASHLLKLIQALRLLGAEGIITGIQPDVAQTMVALGMNLETIVTLANLRDGLRRCMKRMQEEAKAAGEAVAVGTASAVRAGAAAGTLPA